MAGSGAASLLATWKQVMDDMLKVYKSSGYFKAEGACAFDVHGIDMTSALSSADEPIDYEKTMNNLRSKMFGKDCDTTQQFAYIASFSTAERQLVLNYMTKINKMLQLLEHAKNSDDLIAEDMAELDRVFDEASSSAAALLESDAEAAAMFLIPLLIGVPIFALGWVLYD